MEFLHYPVMHQEVLDNLTIPADRDAVMIDCTTGEGGHTKLFLDTYPNLKVVGIDRDREIQKKAIERFKDYGDRFTPVNAWFNDYLSQRDGESADAILFDLGISIFHYEESSRGFSFRKEEKLDMRLDESQSLSAESIVNEYSEEALADVIYKYGEERYSRRIARTIVEKRKEKKIETSSELAYIISGCVPREYRYGRIHPATRTFQALRIEVNKELDRISPALENALRVLNKGGRVAVITFHSLEDRIVKWYFKDRYEKYGDISIITKKPIIPTDKECDENPPSRSAKLRIVEKR
ncbi:MAG: 16S rRNA (cytosine(1402)-N(4))-methyltransferase RsmH [Spirochaetales bacterium]|nr:16S rRNA (cytosine(1402)-N(4))-methyltransferase RsmH [Spirochaetales bacterium]